MHPGFTLQTKDIEKNWDMAAAAPITCKNCISKNQIKDETGYYGSTILTALGIISKSIFPLIISVSPSTFIATLFLLIILMFLPR